MKTATLAALALLLAGPAGAGSLAPVAKALARGAERAGVRSVAVLPFKTVGGAEDGAGRLLAEDLSGRLAARRGPDLVERARLDAVMDELFLGQSGALAAQARPGRLAGAQAVVTGVYAALGAKAEVHARLVRVDDGVVLASAKAVVPLAQLADDVIPAPMPIAAAEAGAEALEFQGRSREARRLRRLPARRAEPAVRAYEGDLRDAPADACADWRERSDRLQEGVLELKARYWAAQAGKKGFKAPAEAPGASFFDPALKGRFLELMEEAALDDAAMSLSEVRAFLDADRAAFELRARCGR